MERDQVLKLFERLRVWKRGTQRAPEKPLSLLLMLGYCAAGRPRQLAFQDVDGDLQGLLQQYGSPRREPAPAHPFWRLRSEPFWNVSTEGRLPREADSGERQPTPEELVRAGATAGLELEVYRTLRRDSDLRYQLALDILQEHFPETLWGDLLASVGLERQATERRRGRHAAFRQKVLDAYNGACAVCGFDAHQDGIAIGLGAAHIQWRAYGGSDTESNGLALCAIHHALFDTGVVSVDDRGRVLVSAGATGGDGFGAWVLAFHGAPLREPRLSSQAPTTSHLAWHRREVFRRPARED